jgi:hypothetical protein
MPPNEDLRQRIAAQVTASCDFPDAGRDRLVEQLCSRYGRGLAAILIYGSYLRGKRDTLLDFYVLLDGYASLPQRWQVWLVKLLPPNVYQVWDGVPPRETRAKCALLSLERFESCVRRDFHSYFWARFAQPSGLLYARDEAIRERVIDALAVAGTTFARRVTPILPDEFGAAELWSGGLEQTYACEFRSEPPGHASRLYGYWPDYYAAVTACLAHADAGFAAAGGQDRYRNTTAASARRRAVPVWRARKVHGKVLSTLRLVKAAFTFDGALEYLLWKIHRHSGIYLEPTPRQVRFPLLFAWPLLWRLWRQGAFR